MKTCSFCRNSKPLSDFNRNAQKPDGRAAYCRDCMKHYRKGHYEINKKRLRSEIEERKRSIKEWFAELKATLSCEECGFAHPAAIDFHHRDPGQKEIDVAYMVHTAYSRERILSEIAKCDVLCSNCHRILHYNLNLERPAGIEPVLVGLEAR